MSRDGEATFRIEALLRLDHGITLYKVKSESEPFDRIVAESDLSPRPVSAAMTQTRGPMRNPLIATPVIALCLLAATTRVSADTPSVEFDGQRYRLDYQNEAKLPDGQPGNGLAEFTLEGESGNDWSKLFAFHVYPEAGDDPTLAAATLGKVVQNDNPDANFALQENKDKGAALVDFLTWQPGSDVMEFNVFKYARAEYGPGLVALQYAQRFKLGDLSVDDFRALRERAVKAMAETEIAPARDYFAGRTEEQLGSARGASQGLGQGAAARAGGER
jgi:hypothetical protein